MEIACRGVEEAHMRSLLLHALSEAGLGLRRIESEDIPDTSKVTVTAQAVAAKRNDASSRSSAASASSPTCQRRRGRSIGRFRKLSLCWERATPRRS